MILVRPPVLTPVGRGTLAEADVVGDAFAFKLFYRTNFPLPEAYAEPFLLPAMLAAMASGEPVRALAPVSGTLLERLPVIQRIYANFYPDQLRAVDVEAPVRAAAPSGSKVAAFFSGGVDSFATVLRHRAELSSLVLVQGSDIDLTNDEHWNLAHEGCTEAAGELGLELLTVATNVRELTERAGGWNPVGHGLGFGSVALLLQADHRLVYFASSTSVADLHPWGSHPLLDPLFSTDRLSFVHDALELTRVDKVALIAGNEIALRHLRVCNRQTGRYNCGECEKCLRTAVVLHLLGALARCDRFPYRSVTPEQIDTLWLHKTNVLYLHRDNLRLARRKGAADIAEAIEWALWRYEMRAARSALARLIKTVPRRRLLTYLPDRIRHRLR